VSAVREGSEKRYRSLATAGGRGNFVVLMAALSMILLAFFILLYSVAVVDEQRRLVALDSLLGSFGFMPGGFKLAAGGRNKQLQPPSPLTESAADVRASLHDFLAQRGILEDVKVRKTADGLAVDLRNRLLFASGSYQLAPAGKQVLLRLAGILRPVEDLQVVVKGYCDRVPVKEGGPYASNLSLAALRAAAVFRFLVRHGGLDPAVVSMRGYGAVAAAGGPAARERRVEIDVRGGPAASGAAGRRPRLYHYKDFTLPITGGGQPPAGGAGR